MQFETGDIILIKVNHFSKWYRWLLAKLIQLIDGVYYHHAGTIAGGKLYEADTKVIANEPYSRLKGDEVIVFRLRKPLTAGEKYVFDKRMKESVGKPYDYFAVFIHQLIYILTLRRVWLGRTRKKARQRPYCTELVTEAIHHIRGYFPEPWKIGPSGLIKQAALYYDVVYEGKV